MAAALLALTPVLAACGGGEADANAESAETEATGPLTLGLLPSQAASELMPDARKLGDFLAEQIGRPVEVIVPSSYEPLVEGLRFGHVDAAFLDGGPAWFANARLGAEVILAEVSKGETFYWAEAFGPSGTVIDSLSGFRGKRVAFTSRTGASGFLMPVGMLASAGVVSPEGDDLVALDKALASTFALTIDAGGYAQALRALLDGRVDIAFGAHDSPERFLEPAERERITSVYRFGRIPSHAVVVRPGLDSVSVNALRNALLSLNDSTNVHLLQAIYGVDGLRATNTTEHLGDFGRALAALPAVEQPLMARKP